jgi:hypothetical protein
MGGQHGQTAVWWIRRDLRLADNEALHAALAAADQVIPLFIADPFFQTVPQRRRASGGISSTTPSTSWIKHCAVKGAG